MKDVIFCALPYSNMDHIYSAPAILKGVAMANGFTASTVDFGCDLFEICGRNKQKFDEVQSYFLGMCEDRKILEIVDHFYQACLRWFRTNPSRFIGISVLSIYTHKSTFDLAGQLRQKFPERQIIVGGRGLKMPVYSPLYPHFNPTGREKMMKYHEFLSHRNLTDHVVIGDGEDALLQILQGLAVVEQENSSDSFRYPTPNYDDYQFSNYLQSERLLPITGSKGCVRECDFCDIKFQFGKYRYRSGRDIAREMIALNQQFGVKKFQFTDSLVNGGMKPFKEFVETLARHNDGNKDNSISWTGQYICRPSNQVPQELYEIMSNSGAEGLTIGAESGSNKVLAAMNKKTTVEALYDELESFAQYNITCVLLTFVGHWSETWQDFLDHCKMFVKIAPFVRKGTISAVCVGHPMNLLDGTPVFFAREHNMTVTSEFNRELIWYNKNNPENTFKERVRRHLIVHHICDTLRIPRLSDVEHNLYLANTIDLQHQKINEFYTEAVANSTQSF